MKNHNSLPYVSCFVTMVTQQKRSANGHWLHHCITMLPKHAAHSKLFWIGIVFTRRAFWDHCQQNWTTFTCLTPVEPKNWPLTFSSITTKRYVVDRSNYTFPVSLQQEESVGMALTTLKQLLNLTPVQTILWPTGFLYRMWPGSKMKWWFLDPYQHNEIIKPFVSFQLSKLS